MLKQILDLNFVNHFMSQFAFQGIEIFKIALFIFSLILVCLSYVLYKMYRANKRDNSMANMSVEIERQTKQLDDDHQ